MEVNKPEPDRQGTLSFLVAHGVFHLLILHGRSRDHISASPQSIEAGGNNRRTTADPAGRKAQDYHPVHDGGKSKLERRDIAPYALI
jgi:hypothetical protein